MVAVDTNLLVRLLVDDEPSQTRVASRVFAKNQVWVSRTVLTETVWVLSSTYGAEELQIRNAITGLAGLDRVTFEDKEGLLLALEWSKQGMGFADAIHVSAARAAQRFLTFDQKLVKTAKALKLENVQLAS